MPIDGRADDGASGVSGAHRSAHCPGAFLIKGDSQTDDHLQQQ